MKKQKIDILNAASVLFHKKGFKATTLQEIAAEVHMEAPSLYNHIQSKQAILADLLLRVAVKFINGISSINESSLTGIQRLERVIELHISLSIKYPHTMSLMLAEYVHLDPTSYDEYVQLKDDYEAQFDKIIQDSINEGEITNLNKDLLIFNLLSTLRSIYAWIGKHEGYNEIELQSQLKHFLLSGVRTV